MLHALKRFKVALGWLVLVLTLYVFARYISSNPQIWWQLQDTSILTILGILLGYTLMTALLAALYRVMTTICKVRIPHKDNLLLTMYSSVVNFFGPLQSGPGFRTVYLKKRYNINVPAYVGVSLLYYACFAAMSGCILLSAWLGWWIVLALPFGLLMLSRYIPRVLQHPIILKRIPHFVPLRELGVLAALSALQVFIVAGIYYVELQAIAPGVTIGQALIYTGAANFALFVSLTPGALGFRESFLYMARSLHGMSESTIVAANILDRAVYVVFLVILFAIIVAVHGQKQFSRYVVKR